MGTIPIEDVPVGAAKFGRGDDGLVHIWSGFGDTWCGDEREVWAEDPIEYDGGAGPFDEYPDDMCKLCIADEDTKMELGEEMFR